MVRIIVRKQANADSPEGKKLLSKYMADKERKERKARRRRAVQLGVSPSRNS